MSDTSSAVWPLVGVLIGGAITSVSKWLELRHNRYVAKQDAQLKRLEDICDSLHTIRSESLLWSQSIRLAIKNNDLAKASSITTGSGAAAESVAQQIRTYVPKLKPLADEFMETWKASFHASTPLDFAGFRSDDSEFEAIQAEYTRCLLEFTGKCLEISEQIVKEIQTLAGVKLP